MSQRRELYKKWPGKEGNTAFFLGAKSASDRENWKPELEAIRAVIKYTRETARFKVEAG